MIKSLAEHRLQVPKDVIVCGYNNTLLARKMIPTLSSVASPIEEIAGNAVSMLEKKGCFIILIVKLCKHFVYVYYSA